MLRLGHVGHRFSQHYYRLNHESAWIPRAIDVTGWKHGKESRDPANVLVFKTLELKPGSSHEIRVASPAPSEAEESQTYETN